MPFDGDMARWQAPESPRDGWLLVILAGLSLWFLLWSAGVVLMS